MLIHHVNAKRLYLTLLTETYFFVFTDIKNIGKTHDSSYNASLKSKELNFNERNLAQRKSKQTR